jgi:hypothetical protein
VWREERELSESSWQEESMIKNAGSLYWIGIGTLAWGCDSQVDVGGLRGDAGDPSSSGHEDASARAADAAVSVTNDSDGSPFDATHDALVSMPPDSPACATRPSGDDASCWASCCIPAGPRQALTSIAQFYAAVGGRWEFCSGLENWQSLGAPSDAIGAEFVPVPLSDQSCGDAGAGACTPGDMYFLVQGPSGPVRGLGFAYQWTYNFSDEVASGRDYFGFALTSASGGSWDTTLVYSPCPTEIEVASLGYRGGGIMVPFY